MMAVWTPGSYLVREYEKNVENISARARDGGALAIEKTLKNRWRVRTNGAPAITVTYRVYCREMGVRSNWVEDGFAMLNGAATFITLADQRPHVHEVNVELPQAWHRVMTAMPDAPDGGGVRFRAPDYDTLVDSPMVIGNPGGLRVHGRRQEAFSREHRRRRRVGRRRHRARPREDRPAGAHALGLAAL